MDFNDTERSEEFETNWTTVLANYSFQFWMSRLNESMEQEGEYIFDRYYVRVIFIILYSIVFFLCFVGNSVVLLVVSLHWRMRHVTKLCLANLAVADLCVGIFCVYQNLSTYLIRNWILGEFLCKMYQFMNSLSHTASILTLVVVSVERYVATIHPLRCRQMLTKSRLRVLIATVWIASGLYCSPRLVYMATLQVPRDMQGLDSEIICTARRTLFDSRTFDMINSILLFLIPLILLSVLYFRVALVLWRSTDNLLFRWPTPVTRLNSQGDENIEFDLETLDFNPQHSLRHSDSQRGGENKKDEIDKKDSCPQNPLPQSGSRRGSRKHWESRQRFWLNSASKVNKSCEVTISPHHLGREKRLRSRQSVVKMLIVIVLVFTLCQLPFHLRKLAVYWKQDFDLGSIWNTLFLALSHLSSYVNCAVNPIIYSYMSSSFRESLRELVKCRWRRRHSRGRSNAIRHKP